MDSDYCDSSNVLLHIEENWCLRREELCDKAEIQNINTFQGSTADVGIMPKILYSSICEAGLFGLGKFYAQGKYIVSLSFI